MAVDIFPGATLRQLVEWGFPKGTLRAVPPRELGFSVIHITGNSRLPSADGEISWRQEDPDDQNSATFFVNRDGSIRQALGDPLRMAPWANGDIQDPDLTNPRIKACWDQGVNPNMRTVVAIENVGFEPGSPITPEQELANAAIIHYFHGKAGVPISRETILGHYQINRVDRPNCPGVDKGVIDRIVALAGGQEEPELDLTKITHQRPKLATIRAGVQLYGDPERQRRTFRVEYPFVAELLASYSGSPVLLGRRRRASGMFWVATWDIRTEDWLRVGTAIDVARYSDELPEPPDVEAAIDEALSAKFTEIQALFGRS